MKLSSEIITMLACPKCKGEVAVTEKGIICQNCRLIYPVQEDIPIMLVEEASPLAG